MTSLHSLFGAIRSRALLAIVIFAAVFAAASAGTHHAAENVLQNAKFAFAQKPSSGQLHVIEMDAASVAAIEEWPWSRDHYARVVKQLDAAGVRSIGFDVDFASHSSLGGDAEFAEALANSRAPLILPTFAQAAGNQDRRKLDALPIESLRDHAKLGSVAIAPDPDGFVRRMPFGTVTDGAPRPSLAAFFAEQSGAADTSFPIDYGIDIDSVPRHSFIAVEQGTFHANALRGKDVLIGGTAIEMGDRYPVPSYGVIPGVLIQALGAETLFAGPTQYGSWQLPLFCALLLGVWILLGKTYGSTGLRVAFGGGVMLAGWVYAQDSLRIWFELVPALVMLIATGVMGALHIAQTHFAARRKTDTESGLPNTYAMQEAVKTDEEGYVIAAMIDNFDTLKAVIGREDLGMMLRRVSERITLPGSDTIAYRTDDRVLSWTSRQQLFDIEEHLAGLRALMRSPVEIGGRKLDVALTFGVASMLDSGAIANAAHAASVALRKGEKWRLHQDDSGEQLERQVSLMGDLDAAIEEGHIKVYYQPKLDLKSNTIHCAEALVRWEHPVRGMLPPDSFIPLAEESGRIEELTLHVIRQTIEDMRSWCAQNLVLGAAVNISAPLLSTPSFVERADRLIADLGVPTERLTFEVTESAELEDADAAIAALNRFRARGISISMDDYGTGQSTLSYLKALPISELKIDRCFVQHAHRDRGDAMLVRSTIQLAHELGLKVVAEGIEEVECLDFLRTLDCDYAQGYFVGKPMTADQLSQLIARPLRDAA